ncbi:MAG: glycerol-3-phosphate dehydrogenase [Rhodobacterales bacterium]|nr:glycerol-3-phosphate dehydrogenase [Rhodobacterales bacterium]
MSRPFDIAVIGGGINGCGIARDAAGRGATVFLCERDDLGGATSSASTKLIHGGLRYLEHYEFRLVRESLIERERLWAMAPHIIWPLRFVLPVNPKLRPAWLVRLGLFLYDNLGGRERLPGTARLDLRTDEAGEPLKEGFRLAYEYSDCWVDDVRMVLLNAMDAAARGAVIRPRTPCVKVTVEDGLWRVTVRDAETGAEETVSARVLVNATGPWVSSFLAQAVDIPTQHRVRQVKGSHIIVPRLFDHDRAYIVQNTDKRIAFAIPYEQDFTLIGTTDMDYQGDPADVAISEEEVVYLCRLMGMYFKKTIMPNDVVATYAGVRPLYDDGASKAQEATRDYVLKVDGGSGGVPPVLNIFGGKITTYRRLAEHALEDLAPFLPGLGAPWSGSDTLPGGDFPVDGVADLVAELGRDYPFLADRHVRRLVRTYGTRARFLLGDAASVDDLGPCFGADLYGREVTYQMTHEWARTAQDVLWRRTKMGLRLTPEQVLVLEDWMRERRAAAASADTKAGGAP